MHYPAERLPMKAAPAPFEDDVAGTITLYFFSNRSGGLGGADIYASTLQPDETFATQDLPVHGIACQAQAGSARPEMRRLRVPSAIASPRA